MQCEEEDVLSPGLVTIDVSNSCSSAASSAVQITVTEGPTQAADAAPSEPTELRTGQADSQFTQNNNQATANSAFMSTAARKSPRNNREHSPGFAGSIAPSVIPPEVPPRSNSPKVPLSRSLTNPVSSLVTAPACIDLTTNSANNGKGFVPQKEFNESQHCFRRNVANDGAVADACFSDSDCSSVSTVVGLDSDPPINRSKVVPRIANNRILDNQTSAQNETEKNDLSSIRAEPCDPIISSISDGTTSLSSPSSSLSASSSAASSFSSASSSSKCASNSYASLSSSPSSNSSKQSVSRETGVRELLLSDSAVETS